MQLAEYALLNQITDEPDFAWWIKKVLNKRDRIISKTAIKYWKIRTSMDCASHIRSRKPLRWTKKMGTNYGGMPYYRK